jgi:Mrp family chromosome partitioning ATPase
MANEKDIRQALDYLYLPTLGRSLGSLNLVRAVRLSESRVELQMAAPAMNELARNVLKVQIVKELKNLPGIDHIEVRYVPCKPSELNEIEHVIAVMSGKGGVGKSLVSGLIAVGLGRKGCSVGILDADITGPSIPKMFGLKEKPIGCQEGFLPVLTASGIAVMSINLLLDGEDEAVIWCGPLIDKAITQFWEEGFWGNLDYLIVDLPPGTADAPLTVIQSLPVSGVVIVSTPQELASMIVRKAISMVRETHSRILAVVENMSYLYLSDINRRIEVFGPSHGEELARAAGAPLLVQIPIDSSLAALCDTGRIEDCQLHVMDQLAAVADLLQE